MVPDIRVACVDERRELQQAVADLVRHSPGLTCVGTLPPSNAVSDLIRELDPDVIVIDPGGPRRHAMEVLRGLVAAAPTSRILVLSDRMSRRAVDTALEGGAWGIIYKDGSPARLVRAIRDVFAGRVVLDPCDV